MSHSRYLRRPEVGAPVTGVAIAGRATLPEAPGGNGDIVLGGRNTRKKWEDDGEGGAEGLHGSMIARDALPGERDRNRYHTVSLIHLRVNGQFKLAGSAIVQREKVNCRESPGNIPGSK
jgi:hypothetical protein